MIFYIPSLDSSICEYVYCNMSYEIQLIYYDFLKHMNPVMNKQVYKNILYEKVGGI